MDDFVRWRRRSRRYPSFRSPSLSYMTVPMKYFHTPSNRIWAAGGGFSRSQDSASIIGTLFEEDTLESGRPCRIDYAPTCCVPIRRDVFAEIGLMDERYSVYSGDVVCMFRARAAGIAMYFIPGAKLWHKVNSLTGGSESDFTYYHAARGRALFLFKHFGLYLDFIARCFRFPRAAFRKSFRHPRNLKWRGMKDGRETALRSYLAPGDRDLSARGVRT